MAWLIRSWRALVVVLGAGLLALGGCDRLLSLAAGETPLARIQVQVSGRLATPSLASRLRVALVWGGQWRPEPFCFLPPESAPEPVFFSAAAVVKAGCPDSFRFVPARVGPSVALGPDGRATLELMGLPPTEIMVGDVTSRVAYGSLVVFEDRNGSGTLELRRSGRGSGTATDGGTGDGGAREAGPVDAGSADAGLRDASSMDTGSTDAGPVDAGLRDASSAEAGPGPSVGGGTLRGQDQVYGASFVSMTRPNQRVAFREGEFDARAAFYPRVGCPPPRLGYSILRTGGFSAEAALAAAREGRLPSVDPTRCDEVAPEQTVVTIDLQAPETLSDVACAGSNSGGTTTYREPPARDPTLPHRVWACVGFPSLGGVPAPPGVQLVVASPTEELCRSVSHYTLRGCRNDPACATPQWDRTGNPPSWWPWICRSR